MSCNLTEQQSDCSTIVLTEYLYILVIACTNFIVIVYLNQRIYSKIYVPSFLFTIQNFDAQNRRFDAIFMYQLFYTGTIGSKGLEIKGFQTFGNNNRLLGTLFFILRVRLGI